MESCVFVAAVLFFAVVGCLLDARSLHIQGFVPRQNPILSSSYVRPAACMAIDDINSKSVLPNYDLTMNISDSKVCWTKLLRAHAYHVSIAV